MIQFQEVCAVSLCQGRNLFCVELAVIGLCYTIFKFLGTVIRKEQLHDLIGRLLVGHGPKLLHGHVKLRYLCGHEQAAILCQSLQDGHGCRHACLTAPCTLIG